MTSLFEKNILQLLDEQINFYADLKIELLLIFLLTIRHFEQCNRMNCKNMFSFTKVHLRLCKKTVSNEFNC